MFQVDPKRVRRPAEVAVAAGVVWLAGISPVSGVYLEPDPARRLAMLLKGRRSWVAGQHVAAAGTAAMPAAFARLALALPAGRARTLVGTAAVALAAGAPLFVSQLALRASDPERFAARRLPGWPFLSYAWLHVLAVGSLSGALASLPDREKEAAAVGLAALGAGTVLAKTGDIPPFVFYVAEQLAAASFLRRKKALPPGMGSRT
ncbi:hypothetical protein FHJ30_01570 [Arthrobacter sp. BB-1]|uniref:hypothetical protein n=1 Tax=Micrococcaceae TaxID=1268 RepID=UPI001111BBD4|nr:MULTISPECIES: hypothetical protein [Micrococcaceae]TNB76833.1 hypothetical protein FHJ30_01570 [Arthrobacter sp. BB-1]UEL28860.1 hypothetical protein KTR40_01460 [Pseudarthrobacter sp. L1SW]